MQGKTEVYVSAIVAERFQSLIPDSSLVVRQPLLSWWRSLPPVDQCILLHR